jgi:hypothetical protein
VSQLDYVTRSLVRAAAFRALRNAPLWLALAILAAGYMLEHTHGAPLALCGMSHIGGP